LNAGGGYFAYTLNDAVTQYNTRIATFPDNVLAGKFAFEPLQRLGFDDKAHVL